MLLIAVAGPIGSGKTTVLHTLATWWRAQGRRVDGMIAEAVGQRQPKGGAERYDWVWLESGARETFAERVPDLVPPYRFSGRALESLDRWSDGLADDAPPLLILDEFGRLESEGGGLMRAWERVASSSAEIVVVGVRAGSAEAIEQRLGRRFDVRVDPREDDAWERVRAACVEHADWTRVGIYGAGSGGVEVTIGSALHGAQVPMRGLALSSAQAAVMAHAGEGLGRRSRVVWVPFIAAGLKALSPAGSRLRPMLAITIQGVLFAASATVLGWNALGVGLGGALVGMWATAQGFLLQYLLVGSDLLRAYEAVIAWLSARVELGAPGLITVLALWIASWGVVSGAVTLLVWRRRALPARLGRIMERGASRLHLDGRAPSRTHAMLHAVRDIARPVFWLPVLLVVTILLVSGSPAERAFWVVARAATIGFVLFASVRMIDPPRFIDWLRSRGHWGPAIAFARALEGRRIDRGERKR